MTDYECDYCIHQFVHGGKCAGRYRLNPCLLYEKDPKGKYITEDRNLEINFGSDIPKLKDKIEVVYNGIDKTIEIIKILSVNWNYNSRGLKGLIMRNTVGYWSHENGEWRNPPKLKIIK
jgi:hypothetical protein